MTEEIKKSKVGKRPVKATSKGDGSVQYFPSIASCADHFCCSTTKINRMLVGAKMRSPLDHDLVLCPPEETDQIVVKRVPKPKWTCEVCKKDFQMSNKIRHFETARHLAKERKAQSEESSPSNLPPVVASTEDSQDSS
jgi:hypothetical protein